ncbi:2-phospho-L-lactate guanylyltransferase [Jiangella alkaliphila]|uniref:Phosphoenolpyruvate guanylyltransferase n=1 Tax=Jiangella alkaliphila TaxID=419479 RepID=A0A1H2L8T6_9ACTN|nr:2-phospho-L-lactate guanylyltransferase [Jiangella alkaliphila]SDU77413.1 2-phospho-L-lactate guanylyltransferase [Jiangella alkaliphila]
MTTPQLWTVVIPVKRPEHAKTRLADAVGDARPRFARAFAADTVQAALECSSVERVIVVTDDDAAADEARSLGAEVVADTPDAGLNAALRHGAESARAEDGGDVGDDGGDAVAVASLSADLPALRPAELARVLAAAAEHPQSFVADAAGIGTTSYAAGPGAPFEPAFGGRSRAAHRLAGAVELELDAIASVRRDVDTAVDLWDARRLGVGPRTAALLAELDVAL